MRSKLSLVAPMLALWLCASACADGVRYRVVYIPFGPCEECSVGPDPRDINNSEVVCGHLDRYRTGINAELWNPAAPFVVTDLGGLPDCGSPRADIEGMNDVGQVVGWDFGGANCDRYLGCVWSAETGWVALPSVPDSRGSQAFSINNLGQSVGLQGLNTTEPRSVACLWDPLLGVLSLGRGPLNFVEGTADDINDSTWIVGRGNGPGGYGAFLWTPDDGMTIISDRVWQSNIAINDLGHIVSAEWRTAESRDAFIWDQTSGIQYIGSLPDDESHFVEPLDINDANTVVGFASVTPWVAGMERTSFVWSARRGMRDLNRLRDPCNPVYDVRGLLYAVAINDDGIILATPESEFRNAALLIPFILGDLDPNDGGGWPLVGIGDGDVDLQDLAILLSNFGRTGVDYPQGDLDCQGDVDLQDLEILLGNFGETLP